MHTQNHTKLNFTKHSHLDGVPGRCIIIQKWIVQNFHIWMIYKHAQNHPKVDYTKHPILEDANHPEVDYTKHPISDDLKTCSLSSTIGMCQLSKFG